MPTNLRALRTIPGLTIHYGYYLTHAVQMRRVRSHGRLGSTVTVLKTEEKGSDVNLATHLLVDGFRDDYAAAVIISNDSDLLEPVRVVRHDMGKVIGILNPQTRPSRALLPHLSFIKQIRPGVLGASQLSAMLVDATGTFHKPAGW